MVLSRVVFESILLAGGAAAEAINVVPPCGRPPIRNTADLIIEGVVAPNRMTLAASAVPVGSDVKGMIDARRLEIRLRVEYTESSSAMIIIAYLASPNDQLPAPSSPRETSGMVLHIVEVQTDFVRSSMETGGTFAVYGTVARELVPWLGARLPAGTPVSLQMQLAPDSVRTVESITVSWPAGGMTAIGARLTLLSALTRPLDRFQPMAESQYATAGCIPRRY